mgnify:CR=1 FL=1
MNRIIEILISFLLFISCNKDEINKSFSKSEKLEFISAIDISRYPEISNSNPIFHDFDGNQKDFLNIIKQNGVNTIRLKLWVNPSDEHSGFNEVKQFTKTLKTQGFKIWLTLHY